MWEYHASVARVIDADTMEIVCDLGFHVAIKVTIRVLGVDSPEIRTPEGRAAAQYARDLFGADPNVIVRTELDRSFARYIGAITLPDGRDYARVLIESDHGVPYRG